jgi:hypothetical protein
MRSSWMMGPFSFVTFLLGKQKKSKIIKEESSLLSNTNKPQEVPVLTFFAGNPECFRERHSPGQTADEFYWARE